jgi:flagellar motor switch/type III secretory pathway protein FliN|tara:strand:+ start:2265 stop:2513 length:249 start_codon:yes stop_codon:yes gene_type:complete
MASLMKSLALLPLEKQIEVLENLSGVSRDLFPINDIPIEVNGTIYTIPVQVMELIEGLHDQLIELEKETGKLISGLRKDQEY